MIVQPIIEAYRKLDREDGKNSFQGNRLCFRDRRPRSRKAPFGEEQKPQARISANPAVTKIVVCSESRGPNPDKPKPKHFDDAIVNPGTPLSSRPKGEIFRLGGHPERERFLAQRKTTNHEFSRVFLEIFRVRDYWKGKPGHGPRVGPQGGYRPSKVNRVPPPGREHPEGDLGDAVSTGPWAYRLRGSQRVIQETLAKQDSSAPSTSG